MAKQRRKKSKKEWTLYEKCMFLVASSSSLALWLNVIFNHVGKIQIIIK